MDPDANLNAIEQHLINYKLCLLHDDLAAAEELRDNLLDWCRKGGFAPNWNNCPRATKYVLGLMQGRAALQSATFAPDYNKRY